MECEPQLKFRRLEADVDSILHQEDASCFCVAEKLLALGTRGGTIYLLSCFGDQVGVFHAHRAPVQDVCFDERVETVGSCAEDGSIVIQSLVSDEKFNVRLNRALTTLALDPRVIEARNFDVVSGGVSGKLTLSSPGWLGTKNVVLHSSQGPIHQVKWCGNLIAWSNDHHIKVQNVITRELSGVIKRPQKAPLESTCDLYWHPDGTLYIGWASTVIVAWLPVQDPDGALSQPNSIKIIDRFEIQGIVKGVAPFGYQHAILTSKKLKNNKKQYQTTTTPVIQVFSKSNIEISSEALPNHTRTTQFDGDCDFKMIPCFPTSCCKRMDDLSQLGAPSGRLLAIEGIDGTCSGQGFMQWWQDGAEPLYYIFSSKEIFVGTPRDHYDRIQWLTNHLQFSKALSLASVIRQKDAKIWDRTVDQYLEFLMYQGKFKEAAKMCAEVLGTDVLRWEQYVYIFSNDNHLIELSYYIPIQDPILDSCVYNLVLRSLIKDHASHQELLALVQEWPVSLYSPGVLIKEIQDSLDNFKGHNKVLMEVLVQLCIFQGLQEQAMDLFLELQSPKVFDFILQHALFRFLKNRIISLIFLDQNRALDLLSKHIDEVFPEQVISEIKIQIDISKNDPNRQNYTLLQHWLYLYMDRVITENISLAPDYHYLLVDLYAEFESPKLMTFLINSHQYPLDRAFEICKTKGLIKEMVYLLSRMGDAQGALQLIIEELADIPQAIEFARSQVEDDLWDLLINWAVSNPSTTGDLLDHAGGQVDPLRVINKIPNHMEIWNLRNRLCRVISEYRTQTSLQEGSNVILKSDCVVLESQLYKEVQHCCREIYITSNVTLQSQDPAIWTLYKTVNGSILPTSKPSVQSKESLINHVKNELDFVGINEDFKELEVSPREVRSSLEIVYFSEKSEDSSESVRSRFPQKQHSLDRNRDPLPSLI